MAIIKSEITNVSESELFITPRWEGDIFKDGLELVNGDDRIEITSEKSDAIGYIIPYEFESNIFNIDSTHYEIEIDHLTLQPGQSFQLLLSQSFIFSEYDHSKEINDIKSQFQNPDSIFEIRKLEKSVQVSSLIEKKYNIYEDSIYNNLIVKCLLTLQNNWRSAAGELKYDG